MSEPAEQSNNPRSDDLWETTDDDNDDNDFNVRHRKQDLRPVPDRAAPRPGDALWGSCQNLGLRPERFVIMPEDEERHGSKRPDKLTMNLGLCRLVLLSFASEPGQVPTEVNGQPVVVKMSWSTDGPKPDPNASWHHLPVVRILRAYATYGKDQYVTGLNIFPEIRLLANDSPTDDFSIEYFIRPIDPDMIDFSPVRKWMRYCQENHGRGCWRNHTLKELNRSHPIKEVPDFRCIDVEQGCLVRLPQGARYVTLNYALEQPHALESAEYYNQFPLTIRDAIRVTKEIGMRYLWVDSLCIVQDAYKTKGAAIKAMDMVYSASDLVIMAAESSHANTGIDGVRPGTRGAPQAIEEIAPGFRLGTRTRWQDSSKKFPYNKHAWTFQESHFALRKLIFIDGRHIFEPESEISNQALSKTTFDRDDIGQFERLLQEYSSRDLTFQEDVYNAFAGVSRHLMRRLDTDICHGLPNIYFDWFLLWRPLSLQSRRLSNVSGCPVGPSWSWSGWTAGSWPHMWDWYNRSINQIDKGIRTGTWIIWYQRRGHDTTEFKHLNRFNDEKDIALEPVFDLERRNFYGSKFEKKRFGEEIDCSQRKPSEVVLKGMKPPTYVPDILSHNGGSGFLQFWTLSVIFRVAEPTSTDSDRGPPDERKRLGIFGLDGKELGIVKVQPDWLEKHTIGEEREFILICDGRNKRAKHVSLVDEAPGWRYMVMMLEWCDQEGGRHAKGSVAEMMYAERVALGSIRKSHWQKSLAPGPVWMEIILG
ncbi:heterokaryon incompatibility protein-domain-containing protein [Podospora fimiseda]|uniref:Heterokaryon incompatibility protein-domain-containing protein n=1 Tax=Podospora fimiseda TaxID=252190 RepID=A0AAN7H0U1_9PEZI|nr:heterokaryon incompatibility protein-domain-containing protein [Podospora fimiseda]